MLETSPPPVVEVTQPVDLQQAACAEQTGAVVEVAPLSARSQFDQDVAFADQSRLLLNQAGNRQLQVLLG